jgi:hypothetical protein
MKDGWFRDRYLALRWWTDNDVAHNRFRISWINWPLPLLIVYLVIHAGLPGAAILAFPAIIVSVAWLVFNLWRTWRVLRAHAAYGDWRYDKRDKSQLSDEYADGISATRARVRQRIAKFRKTGGQ